MADNPHVIMTLCKTIIRNIVAHHATVSVHRSSLRYFEELYFYLIVNVTNVMHKVCT